MTRIAYPSELRGTAKSILKITLEIPKQAATVSASRFP